MSPPENPRDALASLRALAPKLNAVTDLANATVRDVEKFLNDELSVGLYASVLVANRDEDGDEVTNLTNQRLGGRFRDVVVDYSHATDRGSPRAWSDCTREVKLETFAKLPGLLAEIAKKVEAQLAAAEATARAVAASIAEAKPAAPAAGPTAQQIAAHNTRVREIAAKHAAAAKRAAAVDQAKKDLADDLPI